MHKNTSKLEPPDPGNTSVRMGPSFLRPAEEKDHYELMRKLITVSNDGEMVETREHNDPIGPLAVYRAKRSGDKVGNNMHQLARGGPQLEIKTMHPVTKQPIDLILVWWPRMDAAK